MIEGALRSLFAGSVDGLLTLDGALCVAWANDAAMHLLGAVVAVGEPVAGVLGAAAGREIASLSGSSPVRLVVPMPLGNDGPSRNAGSRAVEMTAMLLHGHAGGVAVRLSARSIAADEATAMERWQALGRRAGGVVHDLNNMLAVVLTAAEAIGERVAAGALALDDASRDDLACIVAAAQRGRTMSRAELSPHPPLHLPSSPLLLDAAIGGLRGVLSLACGPRVQLRLDPQPGLLVQVTAQLLERVLLNLIVNARDAMPDGGVLTVQCRAIDSEIAASEGGAAPAIARHVVIEVRDEGPGIAPEVLARLGEPFFTSKPAGQGTGLGLNTVRTLLAEVGGFLTIASTIGLGTCVAVHLPIAAAILDVDDALPAAPVRAADGAGAARRTVVLVEDDAMLRRLVERALTRDGWRVVATGSAEAALQALAALPAAAVAALVTDLSLPGMAGEALAREVRLRPGYSALPVVLVSGFARAGHSPQRADLQGIVFLAKPYTIPELLDVLESLAMPRSAAGTQKDA